VGIIHEARCDQCGKTAPLQTGKLGCPSEPPRTWIRVLRMGQAQITSEIEELALVCSASCEASNATARAMREREAGAAPR
jgi:hypothetical protein